jgi:hypothetical protein
MKIEPNKMSGLSAVSGDRGGAEVSRVTLVCKNHLDVGFTESAHKVTHDAINWMLPVAAAQAKRMREAGDGDNFVWTTPSWVIFRALEMHTGASLKAIEDACAAGDLAWHALPFTTHTELMDVDLFRFGLELSARLDRRFGRRTIAAKMTDVPGHTRGIIPLLAEAGVEFLHIGVNHMSAVPEVPELFRWRDPASGAEVICAYCRGYGNTIRHAGADHVLHFRMVGDNMEVPSEADARAWLRQARKTWPNAEVRFGRMDEFVEGIRGRTQDLPVIEAEIGDSWIHGVGTDPWKTARVRALLRLRREWIERGKLIPGSKTWFSLSMPLLLACEHTWGVSIAPHLQETRNWSNAAFARRRHRGNFRACEASWQEQRDYVEDAAEAATDVDGSEAVAEVLRQLEPGRPDISGWRETDVAEEIAWGDLCFRLHADNGSIRAADWAGRNPFFGETPFGLLRYQTFSSDDLENFRRAYCGDADEWTTHDFGKPGLRPEDAESCFRQAKVECTWHHPGSEYALWMRLRFPNEAVRMQGAPGEVWLGIRYDQADRRLSWDLRWFAKTATRLPEAFWFSCAPAGDPSSWRMHKLGRWIDPNDVVPRGGRRLHAVDEVRCHDPAGGWRLRSEDAPLVAPGDPHFLRFDNRAADPAGGWHFNLFNNIWGTNFAQWYEDDARFRFSLERPFKQ